MCVVCVCWQPTSTVSVLRPYLYRRGRRLCLLGLRASMPDESLLSSWIEVEKEEVVDDCNEEEMR